MTAFLKRRTGQFFGFFLVCLSVLLASILLTYHHTDPSWNLAIDGPVKNVFSYPGAVIADGMLQLFGIVAAFWIIALFGWGVRNMAAEPLRWVFFRIIAFLCSLLLASAVMAGWTSPQAWILPNSLGGAIGDLINLKLHNVIGYSWISFFGKCLVFSIFSLILLTVSMGITIKQLGHGIIRCIGIVMSIFNRLINGVLYISRGSAKQASKKQQSRTFSLRAIFSKQDKYKTKMGERDKDITIKRKSVTQPDASIHVETEDLYDPEFPTRPNQATPKIIWGQSEALETDEETEIRNTIKDGDSEQHVHTRLRVDDDDDSIETTPIHWDEYELPSIELLDPSLKKTAQNIDPQLLEESAQHLKTVLEEFGVRGDVVTVRPGPVVTMYEFKPAAGIKTSRVIGLADDIARSMSALSARIAVIPGRNVIGIELPNESRETVYLREILQSESYEKSTSQLSLILGKDIGGQPIITDLARMPHLLVAGTTGSGKSVAVNTMILSLLYRLSPDRCRFIMIDPKMLELSVYDGIPHLLTPVVTDPKKAIVALKWAVREMENRYRAMSKLGVRNIDGYNVRVTEARRSGEMLVRRVQTGFDPDSGKAIFENQPLDLETLPYIVVVVDEMADLMMVAGKEIEAAVQRLAQMARAAGIHLIMATQRPSVDVITGTIKANFPTRISFQVTSKIDSRTILGEQGAEQLLGQGDMLYMAGGGRITRVHGPFVRDAEVERVVAYLKTQAEPIYVDSITDDESEFINFDEDGGRGGDALYNQAVEIVLREGKASTSFIQRHLQIGYNKAAGIIETMEKNGIVSAANHVGKREILR
jgi:S-DNA-T family DNA segregation ATPase FtsK/SpoIIIE